MRIRDYAQHPEGIIGFEGEKELKRAIAEADRLGDTRPPRRESADTTAHRGYTDEWLDPPELISALGPFDP